MIDVGGESTRPGAGSRSIPPRSSAASYRCIEALARPSCARRACGSRSTPGTKRPPVPPSAAEPTCSTTCRRRCGPWPPRPGVGWVAMHMAGDPRTMQRHAPLPRCGLGGPRLPRRSGRAGRRGAGVSEVWVDPGIGFGKTTAHNVALLAEPRPSRRRRAAGPGRYAAASGPSGVLLARSDAGPAAAPGPSRRIRGVRRSGAHFRPMTASTGSLATAVWAMIHGARMRAGHDVRATALARAAVFAGCPSTGSRR